MLEYATERAGDLLRFEGKEIGLGVVNPRTESVEPPEQIRGAAVRALRLYPGEKLWLNPDCGFATFANRPVNWAEVAVSKLRAVVEAARSLREWASSSVVT